MKSPKIISVLCFLLIFARCTTTPEVVCVQLDPLEKVLKEQIYFEENVDTVAVAKGETASFQFVLRSIHPIKNLKIETTDLTDGIQTIPSGLKAFVGYVRQGRNTPVPSKDRLISASGYFPDP